MTKRYLWPILISITGHLIIGALLFMLNMQQITPIKPKSTEIIQAVTINSYDIERQITKIKQERQERITQQQNENKRLKQAQQALIQAQRQRQVEQQQLATLKATKIKQTQEARRIEQKTKQAKITQQQENKRLQQLRLQRRQLEQDIIETTLLARKKAEQKELAQAAQARAKTEKAHKQKQQIKQQRVAAEQRFNKMLAQEATMLERAARRQHVLSEIDRYKLLIMQQIQDNWHVDNSMQGKQCILHLTLTADGAVVSVSNGSGDIAVCRSAKAAINKIKNFSVSKDPEVFKQLKSIKLILQPEL